MTAQQVWLVGPADDRLTLVDEIGGAGSLPSLVHLGQGVFAGPGPRRRPGEPLTAQLRPTLLFPRASLVFVGHLWSTVEEQ
ncbi:MAG TPA: hypothetical protein VFY84_19430 [Jiangellales bacterium]|nr:hypothetical protein [Jiangellales bacterium]